VVAVNGSAMYLCCPDRFRLANVLCVLFVVIVPGSPSLLSKYAAGGENSFEFSENASSPPMNVMSNVCFGVLYAANVALTLPM
jgi:hypothetical protein